MAVPASARRRFGRLGLVAVTVLLSIELLLQLGGLVVFFAFGQSDVAVDESKHRILCLGDSFTYGIGAEDPPRIGSYPAQLQEILDQRADGRFQVINRGWPGLNSRKILRYLTSDLEEFRPGTVVILCGVNDRWSEPKPLDLDSIDPQEQGSRPTFEWRWRSARLVRMVVDSLTSPGPQTAEARDAALKELDEAIARFESDGDEMALRRHVRSARRAIEPERLREVFGRDRQGNSDRRERATDVVAEELGYERRGFLWRKIGGSEWVSVVEPRMDESFDALVGVLDTWKHHLRQIVGACREVGAEVVLLTYPHQFQILDPETLEPIQEAFPSWATTMTFPTRPILKLGDELDVPVLETLLPMQRAAAGRDEREFFVEDGHCADAGYRVIAEVVAEQILR